MKFFQKIFLALLMCVVASGVAGAQVQDDSIKVSLITCYPGSDVYELYGHTALRVQQGLNDAVFNYGIFSFNEPNFVYRFVKGDANYILAAYPFSFFLPDYVSRGSKVVAQNLNLNQNQCQVLLNFLMKNAEPQNRSYRYNYIYDNCSTRPRDVVERVLGASLRYDDSEVEIKTFRTEMARFNTNYPWQQFGIDLALGMGLDHNISYREQMFVPIVLMNSFAKATIITDGVSIPLVSKTDIIFDAPETGAVLPPTPWYLTPLTFSLALLLLTIAITICDIRGKKVTKIFDTILYLVFGLGGCVVFFLVFISTHAATSPNFLAVWLNPFLLALAILTWIKRAKRLTYWLHFINFTALFILLCAWDWLPQAANVAFFPLMACSAVRSINYIIQSIQCEKEGK